jgi:hypothetical protein
MVLPLLLLWLISLPPLVVGSVIDLVRDIVALASSCPCWRQAN